MMWIPDWTRRDRTHLYIIPRERYSEQEFLTNVLAPSAVIVDWRKDFLETARPAQKRLSLTIDGEKKRLKRICDADKQIFSIINTEYMLARFDENERRQLWLSLWNDFPHLNGILLFCVLDASAFLPDKYTLESWQKDSRLFYAETFK